jgi:hypothetical protein
LAIYLPIFSTPLDDYTYYFTSPAAKRRVTKERGLFPPVNM